MIFSIGNHISQIIDGSKTQTRRPTDRYEVGKTYAIQPGRGKFGIPEGRVLILSKVYETKGIGGNPLWGLPYDITPEEANAEGGYTPEEYEVGYEKIYPNWRERWAYRFKFISTKEGMQE